MEFDKYKLRTWQSADKYSLVKYANNYKIWINVDDVFPYPYTYQDATFWINSAGRSKTDFAIATETEAIGGITLRPQRDIYRKSAELGYWLGEPFWGKGITTQAVKYIMEYGFNNLDIIRIFALVFEWNPASMRVLEKNGFKREACLEKHVTKNEKTIDAFLYAYVLK